MANVGWVRWSLGDLRGAEPYYRSAMEGRLKALSPGHPHTVLVMRQLADLLQRFGQPQEVRNLQNEADRLEAAHPSTPP